MQSFKIPITSDEHEFVVTVSIGIAIAPTDGINASQLLRNADLAMYQSKRLGRNTFHYYTDTLSHDLARRHSIEKHLVNAIKNDEFLILYQPIISVNNQSLVGAEALLRWNSNELGAVDVNELIAIAEQIGFIHDVGEYVFDKALCFAQGIRSQKFAEFRISINVSPIQILKENFVAVVERYLNKFNLPGTVLEIEITEGVLLKRSPSLDDTMTNLHKLGVTIAIDDFGTGYAAISYLRDFSFDSLKIDRSLISDITNQSAASELVIACLHLCRGLGLRSVAEGVETTDQMNFLIEHQCNWAQGYFIDKPLDAEKFEQLYFQQKS